LLTPSDEWLPHDDVPKQSYDGRMKRSNSA